MPTTIVELPQVGESVTEGTLVRWLKGPGDTVERYEPLVEVETDKVTLEVPSPVAGVLGRLLVEEGSTVPFGAPICEIETDEAAPSAQQETTAPPIGVSGLLKEEPGFVVGPTGARQVEGEQDRQVDGAQGAAAATATPPSVVAASPAPAHGAAAQASQRLSPVVLRLASEHDIPLDEVASIPGSGLDGRVTKQDVLRYIEGRGAAVSAVEPRPAVASGPEEEAAPLTAVRRRIAEHMVRSAGEIPAAWSLVEVDVTGLVRRREGAKEEFRRRESVDLTYIPFVVQAVAQALKEHPRLNSRWGGDVVLLQKRINIGIAVAAPQGLVVPVVHDADGFTVAGLAKAMAAIVDRARQNKLALEDVQGGTFTLNNTGALGSVASQPIINHPQAAIMTTEAIVKRPVVVGDAIAIRSMMNLCMSFDHRIVDGAESGAFLMMVKALLEAVDEATPIY
jgi:2-oxoisovalerate dehydrogenase E2 component (dihydrolipoyl transacylase)